MHVGCRESHMHPAIERALCRQTCGQIRAMVLHQAKYIHLEDSSIPDHRTLNPLIDRDSPRLGRIQARIRANDPNWWPSKPTISNEQRLLNPSTTPVRIARFCVSSLKEQCSF